MRGAVLLLLLSSCAAPPPPPPPPAGPSPEVLRREAAEALAELERTFGAHWGSLEGTAAYKRLGPCHAPFLRQIADANAGHALMALRTLERLSPGEKFTDSARAILYVTEMGRETSFTRWGVISRSGFLPGVYGAELLALGKASVPFLRKLLTDRRRARVTGGQAETTNTIQGDRVCDYAWVFLATILDRPLNYRTEPEYRDPQIRELDLWLDRNR